MNLTQEPQLEARQELNFANCQLLVQHCLLEKQLRKEFKDLAKLAVNKLRRTDARPKAHYGNGQKAWQSQPALDRANLFPLQDSGNGGVLCPDSHSYRMHWVYSANSESPQRDSEHPMPKRTVSTVRSEGAAVAAVPVPSTITIYLNNHRTNGVWFIESSTNLIQWRFAAWTSNESITLPKSRPVEFFRGSHCSEKCSTLPRANQRKPVRHTQPACQNRTIANDLLKSNPHHRLKRNRGHAAWFCGWH